MTILIISFAQSEKNTKFQTIWCNIFSHMNINFRQMKQKKIVERTRKRTLKHMAGCQLKVPYIFENCSTQQIAFWTDIVWKIEQFSKCITYAFQSQVMWYCNVDQNNNNQPKLWPLGGQFVCTCLFVWFYLLLDVFQAKLEIRFPLCWFAPQNLCIPIKLKKNSGIIKYNAVHLKTYVFVSRNLVTNELFWGQKLVRFW